MTVADMISLLAKHRADSPIFFGLAVSGSDGLAVHTLHPLSPEPPEEGKGPAIVFRISVGGHKGG
jgi:hypothetical protein